MTCLKGRSFQHLPLLIFLQLEIYNMPTCHIWGECVLNSIRSKKLSCPARFKILLWSGPRTPFFSRFLSKCQLVFVGKMLTRVQTLRVRHPRMVRSVSLPNIYAHMGKKVFRASFLAHLTWEEKDPGVFSCTHIPFPSPPPEDLLIRYLIFQPTLLQVEAALPQEKCTHGRYWHHWPGKCTLSSSNISPLPTHINTHTCTHTCRHAHSYMHTYTHICTHPLASQSLRSREEEDSRVSYF